jgi:phosphopantothenoylcysteine decarboxylase/phosphopantothenate--cysteine ligase
MSSLSNKQILLGVTGGIAAYKSAELIRRLQDRGANVRVVMTPAAKEFITPLTLQALSGNPVHTELLDPEAEAAMGHIELARWADLILVAPASADFMARLAQGQGNDLLTTLCLACSAPIAIAPAMNQAMWKDPSTQDNRALLSQRQISIFGPADGSQACGDVGPGRMLEAQEIATAAESLFSPGSLAGKRVVITAGPTREAIDPVRYISNHSSGKMGYAIAQAAIDAGAHCTLISGPTHIPAPSAAKLIPVISALDMHAASMEAAPHADIFIASAAVADYRPLVCAEQKMKKTADDSMNIEMIKNPDIVASVAALEDKPFTVGFAAETQDLERYAKDKLKRKKLNLIVANDVSNSDIGFNSDNNAATVFGPDSRDDIEQCSKHQLARQLIALIAAKTTDK